MSLSECNIFLDKLQVYAADCYNIAEQHAYRINQLNSIEDLENYDYTQNYPEILNF